MGKPGTYFDTNLEDITIRRLDVLTTLRLFSDGQVDPGQLPGGQRELDQAHEQAQHVGGAQHSHEEPEQVPGKIPAGRPIPHGLHRMLAEPAEATADAPQVLELVHGDVPTEQAHLPVGEPGVQDFEHHQRHVPGAGVEGADATVRGQPQLELGAVGGPARRVPGY